MTLKSMTGFARRDGQHQAQRWHWEVRSVNGRGLDVRLRLPPGSEGLEPGLRAEIAKRFTRGNISITLTTQRDASTSSIRLNEAALATALAALERIRASGDFERPRPEGILALKGVLEPLEADADATEDEACQRRMLSDYAAALDALSDARATEGERLATLLRDQLAAIAAIVARIAAAPTRAPEAIRRRLADALARILEAGPGLDPARLHQEAALLATKADVAEELDRLTAHIAAARDLLAAREPVGRKLDFLAQEFNREANTLCSKANDVEITRMGLELKAVIDQMREQVQNIE
jgi:uncharacterized protein (TIGR00255 family)